MNAPGIVASTLGLDLESSRAFNNEYQYQAGRTLKPVYVVGDDYFCVSKTKRNPRTTWVRIGLG